MRKLFFSSLIIAVLMVLSALIYVSLHWWMFFSYCVTFILACIQWGMILCSTEYDSLKNEGYSIPIIKNKVKPYAILIIITIILEIVICSYPILMVFDPIILTIYSILGFWIGRYEGGVIVTLAFLFVECTLFHSIWNIITIYTGRLEKELFVKNKIKEEKEIKKRERRLIIQKENEKENDFISANGIPDKTIKIDTNNFDSSIHVYEAKTRVFIMGKEFKFSDLISCSFSDNPTTKKGNINATTTTGTGSMVGRAIVGDIIAGPAGALIGGTTAKKNTKYSQEADVVIHNYTVIINVNSIANPIIRIHTGSDAVLTNDIVGLMNVIIKRN